MDEKEHNKAYRKTVVYTSKIVTDEDGDKFPVHRKVRVDVSHTKVYDAAWDKLFLVGACAKGLMGFIVREMDSEGMIRNDIHTKRSFRLHIKKLTEDRINYSEASMNIAFSELAKTELLTTKGKGLFKVNPLYFYRNSDSNRLDVLKEEFEYKDNKQYELQQSKATVNDNA